VVGDVTFDEQQRSTTRPARSSSRATFPNTTKHAVAGAIRGRGAHAHHPTGPSWCRRRAVQAASRTVRCSS
jgi:hypothetical protein